MNKAGGSAGIPVELFQILKDDVVKALHSICQQIWKTQQWPQDWKRSVFIPISKKGNAKECSSYHTTALISHASKLMLKILQTRLQQHVSKNFQMSSWIQKRQRNQRSNRQHWMVHRKSNGIPENIYFCFIDHAKSFDCVDHNKLENSSRDENTRPPYLPPEKSVCTSRSNSQN